MNVTRIDNNFNLDIISWGKRYTLRYADMFEKSFYLRIKYKI